MTKKFNLNNPLLFERIKTISNPARFKILEIVCDRKASVTQIGKIIGIKYRRCSEYIRKMEKLGLVNKKKDGKEVFVESNIELKRLSEILEPEAIL